MNPLFLSPQEILDNQVAAEREQYQPSAAEKFFAIVKSMLLRGMVIYFIMSMFRRPQAGQQAGGSTGADGTTHGRIQATNLFENGTYMVNFSYLT